MQLILLAAIFPGPARADTRCVSVAAFNDWMQDHEATDTLTLQFDVTGVNPADFPDTKGALADFTDLGCPEGAGNVIKVYGPAEPENTAHPAGTLKQEYGYACGPTAGEETWASPNPSEVVFVDGSERCDVTMWIDPLSFGYTLDCAHGRFEAEGENTPAMPVDYIEMFALTDGSTWELDHAVSTWNEVCFDAGEAGGADTGGDPDTGGGEGGSVEVAAVEDVTVAVDHATSVYSDETDLCVEAGYSEVYLKFDLSAVPGAITGATLTVDARADGSANGSGAEVYAVADTSWSEASLTWAQRPGGSGAALDRIGPIEPSGQYSLDVGAALSAPGIVAFALIPAASDTDGAHFESGEGAPDAAPRLVVTWEATTGDDNSGDGGDSGGTGASDSGQAAGVDDPPASGEAPGERMSPGCGCAAQGAGPSGALMVLAFAALGLGWRRRAPGS